MSIVFRLATVAAAMTLALTSAVSFAQSNGKVPEITVMAETPVVKGGFDADHEPVEIAQLSRRVGFADLKLGTRSGARELHRRIEMAAEVVCDQLARHFPTATEEELPHGSCVEEAISSAKAQVDAAIAAAEKAMHGPADGNRH